MFNSDIACSFVECIVGPLSQEKKKHTQNIICCGDLAHQQHTTIRISSTTPKKVNKLLVFAMFHHSGTEAISAARTLPHRTLAGVITHSPTHHRLVVNDLLGFRQSCKRTSLVSDELEDAMKGSCVCDA